VYNVNETEYDSSDWHTAMPKTYEWGEKIPLGVFYRTETPTYHELDSSYKHGSPVAQTLGLTAEQGQALVKSFM
jgi:2-oxoglutarate ferredoxin oxidoreductase subunit beta